ncbi:MAG: Methylaspartate mutase, E subunit [Candidatus Ozemobacter sibiricus]|uniref:Glutamate mutase epsilon subunit n=1 Tax=Candidatus Ozemobacter sibiricus TaxID=2268124 RepID=A0A367ZVM9_9BACT|nr:MAG: Methylaspartate mutase, E subunit [Candidatus Ozemobacter sibiricus]
MKSYQIPFDRFLSIRAEVLKTWPTGEGLTLEDGLAYQRTLPPAKNFARAMATASREGRILLQPRAGVALIPDHIKLLQYLETEGEADLLPTTIDAYTRQNRYQEAANGIQKSLEARASLLNGFPAVNHGVAGCRQVVESVRSPIQVRHGTPDARLLAEITLAAGFTSFEGGGISYNIPYAKKVPLAKSIEDWKYVDRLVGWYEEQGIPINREPFGPLTGTLVPPFISHAVAIIEGVLALRQGVRSLTLGYGQGGNLIQDVAAMVTLKELAHEYFAREGFTDYELTTVFHQWMGGFPEDEAKAFAVICWGSTVAVFARADKIIAKSPHEAMGIPTKEANAQGLRASRQVINMLRDQKFAGGADFERETDLIRREVRCLLDKVYELGHGDLEAGTIAAFAAGVLDVPFAPAACNHGKILPMRDHEGYIRVFNRGQLPLSAEILDFHRSRLEERAKAEKREVCFQMVTDDIYAVSKGRLVGRPR